MTDLQAPRKRMTPWLAVPVGMYLLLAVLYLLVVPPGESPDEPGHLRCIEQVAIENHLPVVVTTTDESIDWRARENIISDYMCYHMPAYYVLSGQLLRALAAVGNEPLPYEFPPINEDYDTVPAMFVHDPPPAWWRMTQPVTLWGLRLLSILLGLVILWATYVVARQLFPGQVVVALTAVTLIAGWPQFVFLSRAISNDSLATALAVTILLLLTQVGQPRRFVPAALLSALAFLTKLSVAFTVGMVLAVWLLELLFLADEKRPYWRALFWSGVCWAGLALIVRLHPVLWEHWQFSMQDFSGSRSAILQPAYWQQVYVWTLNSGWAWFGWLSIRPPEWQARLVWLLIQIAALLGVYVAVKRAQSRPYRVLLLILAGWTTAVFISYVRVTSNRWQPQFRFAFAVLPLLGAFAAGGSVTWLARNPKWQWLAWAGLSTALLLYNLWLIFGMLAPVYLISS